MPWFKLSLVLVDYNKNFMMDKAEWSVGAVRAPHSFTGHCKNLRGIAKLYKAWHCSTRLGKALCGLAKLYVAWEKL